MNLMVKLDRRRLMRGIRRIFEMRGARDLPEYYWAGDVYCERVDISHAISQASQARYRKD